MKQSRLFQIQPTSCHLNLNLFFNQLAIDIGQKVFADKTSHHHQARIQIDKRLDIRRSLDILEVSRHQLCVEMDVGNIVIVILLFGQLRVH